ncbi:MAG: RT0821/Lpp0805 family surface protein [Gammaproteobacteria bacterium]|jgi:surface antigen
MRNAVFAASIAALIMMPGITLGDPPWAHDGYGHGRHHYSEHDDQARGGPPPWAPAHGYRRKHDGDRYSAHERDEEHRVAHETDLDDFGISQGTCHREAVGAILGGTVGAIIGSKLSSHDDKPLGAVTGAVIGILVGRSIGHSMDDADQACTGQVLERAADRQSVAWVNPDTGVKYQVTPTDTYQRDGRYCREYITHATIEGARRTIHGTACRNADGSWQTNSNS